MPWSGIPKDYDIQPLINRVSSSKQPGANEMSPEGVCSMSAGHTVTKGPVRLRQLFRSLYNKVLSVGLSRARSGERDDTIRLVGPGGAGSVHDGDEYDDYSLYGQRNTVSEDDGSVNSRMFMSYDEADREVETDRDVQELIVCGEPEAAAPQPPGSVKGTAPRKNTKKK